MNENNPGGTGGSDRDTVSHSDTETTDTATTGSDSEPVTATSLDSVSDTGTGPQSTSTDSETATQTLSDDSATETGSGTEPSTTTGADTGSSTKLDTGTGSASDSIPDSSSEIGTGSQGDDTASESEAPTDHGSDTESVIAGGDTASESEAPTDHGSDTESVTADDSDTGTGPDTATQGDTGTGTGQGITSGVMVHRWRFDGDMEDDVGSRTAAIVAPSGTVMGKAELSETQITLAGGAAAEAEYVSLGSNLLTGVGGPVTIELWATQISVAYYSRIFQFGRDMYHYVIMTWTREENINGDVVQWWTSDIYSLEDKNAPYTLGVEFHIVMVLEPGGGSGGTFRVACYSARADADDIGPAKGTLEIASDTLADLDDSDGWLGKSAYPDDPVANASYNDVRIWSGALSQEDIELLHDLGPTM